MFKWEQLEDTKGVIRSSNSKKDIQHTGQERKFQHKKMICYNTMRGLQECDITWPYTIILESHVIICVF
jgi:hypothetical protein